MLNFDRNNALLIALAVLLAGLVVFLFTGRARLGDLRNEQARIESRIAALHDENRRAREEMERLRSDPRHLEQAIRDRMGFVRDGELVFVFGTEPERGK